MSASTNTRQVSIRLRPNAKNKIQLIVTGASNASYLVEVDPGDTIEWKAKVTPESDGDTLDKPELKKWRIAFTYPSEGGPPDAQGSPLAITGESDPELEFGAEADESVSTYVLEEAAGIGDRHYRFAIAVVDDAGTLYVVDPEIQVRGSRTFRG